METPYYSGAQILACVCAVRARAHPGRGPPPWALTGRCRIGRLADQLHPVASADYSLRIDRCSSCSVRIGVMQINSWTARTGQNWFSPDLVGRVQYCGGGLFTGSSREKSRNSGAINSTLVAGDVIGVHVRGDDVSFSKNGAPIPGKMRRHGPVYMGVQLCSPGDQVSLLKAHSTGL
jgi:hypothetical protein